MLKIEKVTLERKFLLSSKKVYIQQEILLISIRNESKEVNCDKCVKVCEFCSKLSCNSKTFLELGSQDLPLFEGLGRGVANRGGVK